MLLACLITALPADAQRRRAAVPPPRDAATAAKRQMEEAERAQAAELATQRAAAARAEQAAAAGQRLVTERAAGLARLRATEAETARIAGRVRELAERENTAERNLLARAEDLGRLLPLIRRLSHHPAETLLAVQPDQGSALRGVLLLRGLSTQLEREAGTLRAEQAEVARAREVLGAELRRLGAALAAQAATGIALDRKLAATETARREAEEKAAAATLAAAAHAERAESLRAAIAEIEARRQAAEEEARAEAERARRERRLADAAAAQRRRQALARPSGPGTAPGVARGGGQAHGQLIPPVGGHPARGFAAITEAGPASGLTWHPAPGARVVAPCAGKVMFAAPFRSFGLLLILDCGSPYHGVLAGMERLDVQVGRSVRAGERVGMMAQWDPRAGDARPALYMELRRDGRPIDPAPWLGRAGGEDGSG